MPCEAYPAAGDSHVKVSELLVNVIAVEYALQSEGNIPTERARY